MTWAESEAGIHCLREVLVVKVCISFFQSHHEFRERLIVFLKLLHQSLFSGEASYDLWCHWCDALLEERTQYRFPNVRLLRRSLNCSVDAGVVLEWKAGARFRSGNTDALLSDVKFALLLFRLLFMWSSSVGWVGDVSWWVSSAWSELSFSTSKADLKLVFASILKLIDFRLWVSLLWIHL